VIVRGDGRVMSGEGGGAAGGAVAAREEGVVPVAGHRENRWARGSHKKKRGEGKKK